MPILYLPAAGGGREAVGLFDDLEIPEATRAGFQLGHVCLNCTGHHLLFRRGGAAESDDGDIDSGRRGLAIRDAVTYGKAKDMASCALRAATDSATVLVFLLTSQALMLNLDPHNAIQNGRLFSGALICLPLLAAIRLAINAQPDPNTPFGKNLSPGSFYRRIKFMNLVWITAFMLVMALGVTDIPNYWPDRLRGYVPIVTFRVLNVIQKHPFGRKGWYQTLFTNPDIAELQRLVANLAGGLKRREPFYRLYQVLIGGLLLMVLFQMLDAVFPWLTGHSSQSTLFRALGGVLGMSTTVVSWKFVQHANRSAVKALDAEIARMRVF